MIAGALLAVAQVAPAPAPAPAPLPAIAPPLGQPLRLATEEVRGEGRDIRRYRLERTLVFAAEPDGYRVTMTLDSATADGDETRRRLFTAANAPLIGRDIVIRLDRHGALRAVDELEAVWELWANALVGAMGPDPDRRDGAAALAARLRQVAPAEQQRLVAGAVTTLVASGDDRAAGPAQAADLTLAGERLQGSLLRSREGPLIVSRLSAQSPPTAAVRIALTSERRVDPATGLVLDNRRTERRTTATGRSLSTEINSTLRPR